MGDGCLSFLCGIFDIFHRILIASNGRTAYHASMNLTHSTKTIRVLGGTAVIISLPLLLLFLTLRPMQAQSALSASPQSLTPSSSHPLFGFGFNVAAWDVAKLQGMGFNWIKVFSGPGSRLPLRVLLRVEANATDFADLAAFGNEIQQLAQQQKGYVDAYEIGNEPNLDADYGWTVSPNGADYAAVLCEAYGRIKSVDPNAIIVSAGLAPTGRVQGYWEGHPGHNGLFQDEREFLQEFLTAGGGNCFDALGYHPYGFSADFAAAPDVASAEPTQNCVNGFCFRGVEKIYQILQANGLADKKIWATEFGWLVEPPAECLADPGWQGRQWQLVTEQKQADNLVGAYEYATTNWPWMEAMFVFNLNFNTTGGYQPCEQMRFYGVDGRPAETALAQMPKVSPPTVGNLLVSPAAATSIITPAQQPFSQTATLLLANNGTLPLVYTMTIPAGSPLTVVPGGDLTGTLAPSAEVTKPITITTPVQSTGTYTGLVQIDTFSSGIESSRSVSITLHIWDTINQVHLPAVQQ